MAEHESNYKAAELMLGIAIIITYVSLVLPILLTGLAKIVDVQIQIWQATSSP